MDSMINPNGDEFAQDDPLAASGHPLTNEPFNAGESWDKPTTGKMTVARERTERFVRQNPVPVIAGALVCGLAIGWALRQATRDEKEVDLKSPLGNVNWSFLSLPFVWPFLKSMKEKYEDSSDTIKDTVRDGVGRMRKIDLGDYTKPIKKRWRAWTN
jgi:hypothetical protein